MEKLPQIAIPVEPEIFKGFRIYAAMRGLTVAAAGRELVEKVVKESSEVKEKGVSNVKVRQ